MPTANSTSDLDDIKEPETGFEEMLMIGWFEVKSVDWSLCGKVTVWSVCGDVMESDSVVVSSVENQKLLL